MKSSFNAYIDGFNLYKGVLERRGDTKWLDIRSLCESRFPNLTLRDVYYFTANVKERFRGDDSPRRQHAYLRALKDQGVLVIYGKFRRDSDWLRVEASNARALLEPGLPAHLGATELAFRNSCRNALPDRPKTRVAQFEEKGSDVNLASYLLRDVFLERLQNALIITGDSDLVTPIKMVKNFGAVTHVMIPNQRQRVDDLRAAASTIEHIHANELLNHQFPNHYVTRKGGVILRPSTWV